MIAATQFAPPAAALAEFATSLWDDLLEAGWLEQPVVDEFAFRLAANGRSNIRTRLATCAGLGEARMVSVGGGNAEILNLLLFPADPDHQPLLVAELFRTAGHCRVFFLDLPYVGTDAPTHARIASEMESWPGIGEESLQAPEWATRFSTGGFLFNRPADESTREEIESQIRHGMKSWSRLHERSIQPQPEAATLARLQRFKRDHIAEAPNLGFLGAIFGTEWASSYMNELLYR